MGKILLGCWAAMLWVIVLALALLTGCSYHVVTKPQPPLIQYPVVERDCKTLEVTGPDSAIIRNCL